MIEWWWLIVAFVVGGLTSRLIVLAVLWVLQRNGYTEWALQPDGRLHPAKPGDRP
jgi:hypothetical protein